MSLRHPSHQAAIELGECDTEYVTVLKQEQVALKFELIILENIIPRRRTLGTVSRIDAINQRLDRIEELLAK